MNPRTRRLRRLRRRLRIRFRDRDKYERIGRCWECGRRYQNCSLAIEIKKECEAIVARMSNDELMELTSKLDVHQEYRVL